MKSLLTFVVLLACLLITATVACADECNRYYCPDGYHQRVHRYDGIDTDSPYIRRRAHRRHVHAEYHRYCCRHGRAYYKAVGSYGYRSYDPPARARYYYESYDEPMSARQFWDMQERYSYN